MSRTVGIGIQSFEKVIENHCFYVDKTHFIKEWWENHDDVMLIARPRRFGKTLNMSMLDCFFPLNIKIRGKYSKDYPYGRKRNTVKFKELFLSLVFPLPI